MDPNDYYFAVSSGSGDPLWSSGTDYLYPDQQNADPDYYIILPNVPLPITLLTFTARPEQRSIALAWQSASEVNFDAYELERSIDAQHFHLLARIPGRGGSQPADYTYDDQEVKPGITYYYRLKMLDKDGRYEYSPVQAALIAGQAGSTRLYPNPAQGKLYLDWQANPGEESLRVEVFRETGQRMLLREYPLSEGANQTGIDLHTLPDGVYLLRAVSSHQTFSSIFYLDN